MGYLGGLHRPGRAGSPRKWAGPAHPMARPLLHGPARFSISTTGHHYSPPLLFRCYLVKRDRGWTTFERSEVDVFLEHLEEINIYTCLRFAVLIVICLTDCENHKSKIDTFTFKR